MIGLPRVGTDVTFDDPLGYAGTGTVMQVLSKPHDAVLVCVHTITDRTDQSVVGKEVWILAGHVQPMQ